MYICKNLKNIIISFINIVLFCLINLKEINLSGVKMCMALNCGEISANLRPKPTKYENKFNHY